jgi:hypothetical protein
MFDEDMEAPAAHINHTDAVVVGSMQQPSAARAGTPLQPPPAAGSGAAPLTLPPTEPVASPSTALRRSLLPPTSVQPALVAGTAMHAAAGAARLTGVASSEEARVATDGQAQQPQLSAGRSMIGSGDNGAAGAVATKAHSGQRAQLDLELHFLDRIHQGALMCRHVAAVSMPQEYV